MMTNPYGPLAELEFLSFWSEYVLRSVFKRVPWAAERSVPSEPVGYNLLCESDVTISVSNKLPIVLQDITTDITHFSPGQSPHIDTRMKEKKTQKKDTSRQQLLKILCHLSGTLSLCAILAVVEIIWS